MSVGRPIGDACRAKSHSITRSLNPLTPTVAIWVQLYASCARTGYAVICNILTSGHSDAQRQSARMSKITNDGLTRSGTGCI